MISYRRLQPLQFEQWLDHCANVFSKTKEEIPGFREYFKRHFINDPWRDMSTIFVAMDDDKIVGTTRLFRRYVNIDKQEVSMGGIGEVSVNPNYQNMGIASNLMNLANEEMVKSKIHLSFLFGSRQLYSRLGYISAPLTYYKIKVNQKSNFKCKIKKASILDDKDIYEIHKQYTDNINGIIIRNNYYWENWVKDEVKDFYLIKDENENTIAYISAYLDNDNLIIKEYAQKDGFEVFEDAIHSLATTYYLLASTISFQKMYLIPNEYIETKEVNHLMVQLIKPFNDKILTSAQLVENFANTRFGFFNTDNF